MNDKLNFLKQQGTGSRADTLRTLIHSLEDRSGRLLNADAQAIFSFLADMDAADSLYHTLLEAGKVNLDAERERLITLQKFARRKSPRILKLVGGTTALKNARPQTANFNDHPWWFADELVARHKAKQRKQLLIFAGVLAAIIAGVAVLFNTVLKPDPNVIFRAERYESAVEQVFQFQDYESALADVDQAMAVSPDDLELMVFKGILLQKLNRPAEAEALFAAAKSLADAPETPVVLQGRILWDMELFEESLSLAEESVAINPEFAEGWFLAGQNYAQLGEIHKAAEALTKASDLALAQGNESLYTVARLNLAYLTQPGAMPMFESPVMTDTASAP